MFDCRRRGRLAGFKGKLTRRLTANFSRILSIPYPHCRGIFQCKRKMAAMKTSTKNMIAVAFIQASVENVRQHFVRNPLLFERSSRMISPNLVVIDVIAVKIGRQTPWSHSLNLSYLDVPVCFQAFRYSPQSSLTFCSSQCANSYHVTHAHMHTKYENVCRECYLYSMYLTSACI
jgi:hypothetical protein